MIILDKLINYILETTLKHSQSNDMNEPLEGSVIQEENNPTTLGLFFSKT